MRSNIGSLSETAQYRIALGRRWLPPTRSYERPNGTFFERHPREPRVRKRAASLPAAKACKWQKEGPERGGAALRCCAGALEKMKSRLCNHGEIAFRT